MKMILICMLLLPLTMVANNPVELGKVTWLRDIDKAVEAAKTSDKSILILFQEVPGCATCSRYGNDVLSHPLIVEAIETLFVPLAIHNNKRGADKQVLDYFKEPSWNNPVVRIVDKERKDITTRLNGNYSKLGLVRQMVLALKSTDKQVPAYLSLLAQELAAKAQHPEEVILSMYCFWTGEKTLGALDGVIHTLPGFMGGHEVVKVTYDPLKIKSSAIFSHAKKNKCGDLAFTDDISTKKEAAKILGPDRVKDESSFRLDREPKFYLSKTDYRFVPMTSLQATKINSEIGKGLDPNYLLSQSQLAQLAYIKKHPETKWENLIESDFAVAWKQVSDKMKK